MEKKTRRNIKLFNGEQYTIWKFRLRALIAEEEALQVIDKEPPETVTSEWRKMERVAKGYIIEYLSDTMLGIITEEVTARDIFRKLDEIYDRKSLATQLSIQKKLLSFKLKSGVPLMKHFIEFDEMMIDLIASGATINEMGKIAHLLLTLPPSYDGVVTAIQTLSEKNLSFSFVKTRLLDHETKLRNESNDTSKKMLNAMLNAGVNATAGNKLSSARKNTWKNPRQGYKTNQQHYQQNQRKFQKIKFPQNRAKTSRESTRMKCDHFQMCEF